MVVFTCNACNAVVKRHRVENHCYQCRGCQSVSCVDCGKDFWGDDYQTHTKCISEEEKYGRKDAVYKTNKGEAKQEQWIEQVQVAIEQASSKPKLKRLLERIKEYPNIPRKKVKFENFVKNSLKCFEAGLIAASWDVLMTNKNQNQGEGKHENGQSNQTESIPITTNGLEVRTENGVETSEPSAPKTKKERKEERRKKSGKKEKKDKVVETVEQSASSDVSKKSKKRKRQEMEDADENNDADKNGDSKKKKQKKNKRKRDESEDNEEHDAEEEEEEAEEESPPKKRKKTKFNWEAIIKAVLEKKGELPLKKLKRKVLSEFAAQDAANYSEENLSAKFDKKINKIEGVKVSKDRAILKT